MAQLLYLGNDKQITVDRIFADNGQDAEYAMQGGRRVLLALGARKKPTIYQLGKEFYYTDGSPVTNPIDVDYIPENFRKLALEFIEKRAASAKPLIKASKEATKRKRGRPAKPQLNITDIKDAASYKKAGGVEV